MVASMSVSETTLQEAAGILNAVVAGPVDMISDAALQTILTSAVRAYAARVERGGGLAPFTPNAVTATDVAITATAMLEAVNVGIFELSMWQSVKGQRAT
ncbi:hypothetical protein DFP91_4589 [Pseudorhodoplanes sinuspersici]|nr:hypothetical protein DFP91_4589 [Pseudorhodoplanes sinuspersici]